MPGKAVKTPMLVLRATVMLQSAAGSRGGRRRSEGRDMFFAALNEMQVRPGVEISGAGGARKRRGAKTVPRLF